MRFVRRRIAPWLRPIVGAVVAASAALGCDDGKRASGSDDAQRSRVIVFAAASTNDALREAGRRFEAAHPDVQVVFNFDSSSNLARQITAGAPADVYLSADEAWMDSLVDSGDVASESRSDLLANDLVLVVPRGTKRDGHIRVDMRATFDHLAGSLPEVTRIAVGDPSHVPAGRYAKEALESLGWWDDLAPRLLPAKDVRAALRLVELGEADAGIVYASDARRSDAVSTVGVFPEGSHTPIRYPVATCRGAAPAAADFVRFLRASEMTGVFEAAGFRMAPEATGARP